MSMVDAIAAEVRVPAAEADLVSGLLWGAGVTAVGEEVDGDEVVLRVDVPVGGVEVLAAAVGRPVSLVVVDDGLDGWREHARVVRAGRVVVRPPWLPLGPVAGDEVVVEVDPGPTFGHGAHPTTQLCLRALDRLLRGFGPGASASESPANRRSDTWQGSESPANRRPDTCPPGESPANRRLDTCPPSESPANRRPTARDAMSVLDVGCGSGVLAVAAVLLGADRSTGVDIDPEAVRVTLETAVRNGVGDRVAASADWPDGPAALVVANIGAATLRDLAPRLVAATGPGGALVVSGLLDPPPPDLAAAFAPLVLERDDRLDGWTALTLRAPEACAMLTAWSGAATTRCGSGRRTTWSATGASSRPD